MNVVRMNTAHATQDGIREIIRNTRAVSPHLALLIDTKGPEVRTTGVDSPVHYKAGDMVKIFGRPEVDSSRDIINVSYPDFSRDGKVGDHVLFDDGALDMEIVELNDFHVQRTVIEEDVVAHLPVAREVRIGNIDDVPGRIDLRTTEDLYHVACLVVDRTIHTRRPHLRSLCINQQCQMR